MGRYPITSLAALVTLVACGCGAARPHSTAPPPTPADQRVQQDAGRIVVRGDVAPDEQGPFVLGGRYRATFSQRGAGVDFATEVPFTAHLEERPAGGGTPRRIALFERAAQHGAVTVTARGRWTLVVDFGDSPFEIVLAPLR